MIFNMSFPININLVHTGLPVEILGRGWTGNVPPPKREGHTGGDKGLMGKGLVRKSQHNLEVSQISKKCE